MSDLRLYNGSTLRYSRKSYRKGRRNEDPETTREDSLGFEVESPRDKADEGNPTYDPSASGCWDHEADGEIASILHKKCPVIALAHQQLHVLLEGTEQLRCENSRCCRSLYDLWCMCREVVTGSSKVQYALFILLWMAFMFGLLLGAASCGVQKGCFQSPIICCLDSYFVQDYYPNIEDSLRSIV